MCLLQLGHGKKAKLARKWHEGHRFRLVQHKSVRPDKPRASVLYHAIDERDRADDATARKLVNVRQQDLGK